MAYEIDLAGRIAFVTGASSGLGAQFARTLARAGAAVVLASRRVDKLKALRAEIEGEGGIMLVDLPLQMIFLLGKVMYFLKQLDRNQIKSL